MSVELKKVTRTEKRAVWVEPEYQNEDNAFNGNVLPVMILPMLLIIASIWAVCWTIGYLLAIVVNYLFA